MIGFNQKISSTDNKEYYVTSDLHFFHKKVLKLCAGTRPWADVEEMTKALIDHWNSLVGANDVIFHLGDFSFAGKERTEHIISRLNGNIVWIRGNHDYKVFQRIHAKTYDYLEVKYDGKKVCMCHYPMASWNQQGRGSVMLHGHSHGNYEGKGKSLDVGWDSLGEIVTLKEAIALADQNELYSPDHHTKGADNG